VFESRGKSRGNSFSAAILIDGCNPQYRYRKIKGTKKVFQQ
jgi:hypothetical protein